VTDREVEEGMAIELTPRQLFTERCYQMLRMMKIEAPDMITDEQERLIKQAAAEMSGRDFALAMRDFASDVARFQRIANQVEAEFPPDPEFPEDDEP
jgi:hypothetical protein